MQNFYKVTQGNHEKVAFFATRLEGTLNNFWLKCPGRIVDREGGMPPQGLTFPWDMQHT